MRDAPRVLVIGGGFSGAALAVRLLQYPNTRVVLVERSGAFGRGVAYGTTSDVHRLNVRSNRMSLFAEDPDHFVRWLAEHVRSEADPHGFARRSLYGAYLGDVLREAAARAPGRLIRRAGEVSALEPFEDGVVGFLSDGTSIEADAAVLAVGAFAPSTPAAVKGLEGSSRYVADPWAANALGLVGRREDVVLMGAGLTAVDVLVDLEARGWTGKAVAISRRGFLPERHDARTGQSAAALPQPAPLSVQLKRLRAQAAVRPWRLVMDELRPHGQAIWLAMSHEERRRFLRHLRPWWEARRHRLAPDIAHRIQALRSQGRLDVVAAQIISARRQGDRVLVETAPGSEQGSRTFGGAWLVNCTGPAARIGEVEDGLIASLLASGVARPDPLELGLAVAPDLRLQDASGRLQERIFALGPLTRGVFWEITAVPDIRLHARDLARRLDARLGSWHSDAAGLGSRSEARAAVPPPA